MINNVTFAGRTALTAKGNEYQKSNKAKIGFLAGCVATNVLGGALVTHLNREGMAIGAIAGLAYAALGAPIALAIGALVDHFIINKARMNQADGEGARLNK